VKAKQPRQSMYRLGRSFEYRTRDHLRGLGYFVLRSPASKSPIDLVAIRPGRVLLVQCKRNGALAPGEWNELFDLAETCGAVPILAGAPMGRGVSYHLLTGRKDGARRAQPCESFDPSCAGSGGGAHEGR